MAAGLVSLVVSATLLSCCSSPSPAPESAPAPRPVPAGSEAPPSLSAGQTISVRYCHDQVARITAPTHFHGAAPATLWVHGGAWIMSDMNEGGFVVDDIGPALEAEGFEVVALNYRLGPEERWPAQIEDVKCAVRYLRAHATALHIDPRHIGAWGQSAGGHLVSLLALAGPSAGWDSGPYEDESSRIQAAVDMSGPTDLTTMSTEGASGFVRDSFISILGPMSAPELQTALEEASPVHYVTTDAPPFLIIHGDEDTIVYPQQSEELAAALRAQGVPVQLIIVHGGNHALTGAGASPDPAQITQDVVNFFVSNLEPHQGETKG
ncbi:MAG: alpha/beta hydrolase fold domain-containing protein [Acidimicrobiales bacterium]